MTTLCNTGRAQMTAALISTTSSSGYNVFKYVGWGISGSTAEVSTQTSLADEVNVSGTSGLARVGTNLPTQSSTNVALDTFSLTNAIICSAACTISESGLFDATSAGNMMIRSTFTGVPLSSGDSISFTYKLTFV